MDPFIRYILISTFCLSILYIGFLVLKQNTSRFSQLRYYLLISILISLILPFSSFQIELNTKPELYTIEEMNQEFVNTLHNSEVTKNNSSNIKLENDIKWSIKDLITILYFIGVFGLCMRLLIHFVMILYLFGSSKKLKSEKIVLLNQSNRSPFAFFNWIFIPENYYKDEENKAIIIHERIHAAQYHSVDLILIEMLSTLMWFNPIVWMMRKSFELVHEYLADEGVLNTGTDKVRYQALLVNRVAEEKLIYLSSSFNHSLIKKRMIMMTKNNNQGSKFRILTLLPLVGLLFIGIAIINGQIVDNQSDVITVVIDAGHGGNDPGTIAKDEIKEKDLVLTFVKQLNKKANSHPNINFIFTRNTDEFLTLEERIDQEVDLFISIHINYSEKSNISGIECYIPRESVYKIESENFGRWILSELSQLSGIETSQNLIEANYYVLRENKCPAILLNIGYMSNSNDLSYISDRYNQELICDKILNAINRLY